jgi:hypothetical protein
VWPPVTSEPADDGTVLPVNEYAVAATASFLSESHHRFHQPSPSLSPSSTTALNAAVFVDNSDDGAFAKSAEKGWSEVDA